MPCIKQNDRVETAAAILNVKGYLKLTKSARRKYLLNDYYPSTSCMFSNIG